MVSFVDSRTQFRSFWNLGNGALTESANYFNPNKATNIQYRHAFIGNKPALSPSPVSYLPAGELTGMGQARYAADIVPPAPLTIGDVVSAILNGIRNFISKIMALLGLASMPNVPPAVTTEAVPVVDTVAPAPVQASEAPQLTTKQRPVIYHPWVDPMYQKLPFQGFKYHTIMFGRQVIS